MVRLTLTTLSDFCRRASLLRMTLVFLFPLVSILYADLADAVDAAKQAIVNVTESSKPLFDENKMRQPVIKEDEFVKKIRRKRENFMEDQLEERKEFFEKIRANKNMDRRERQQKISKFKRKENEELQEFVKKQKEKLDKHFEKVNA